MKAKQLAWVVFIVMSIVFFALEAAHFRHSVSDENTYFYMAKAVSEGQVPYRDFFLAHPPVHILFLAVFYKLFGFSLFVLKATAPLSIILAAVFMFRIVEEKIGVKEAVVSAALFYFSYDLLRFSTFAAWIVLAVPLMVISSYFMLNKRYVVSAVFMAAACLTGLFSLVGAAASIAYLIIADRKGVMKFALTFFGLFLAANLLLVLVFGSSYMESVYYYHLAKPAEASDKIALFWQFARLNPVLVGAAFASFAFFLAGRGLKRVFVLSAAVSAAFLLALLFINKLFVYYFLPVIPYLAILGSSGITAVADWVGDMRRKQAVWFLAAIIVVSSAAGSYYYLQNTFQDFEDAGRIASYVRDNSQNGDAIFGDDSITPLIAILADRKLAFNFIDGNSLRWRSGLLDINDTMRRIKAENVRFVIERRLNDGRGSFNYGVAYIDIFRDFLKKDCRAEQSFKTAWQKYYKEYYVYDCREK